MPSGVRRGVTYHHEHLGVESAVATHHLLELLGIPLGHAHVVLGGALVLVVDLVEAVADLGVLVVVEEVLVGAVGGVEQREHLLVGLVLREALLGLGGLLEEDEGEVHGGLLLAVLGLLEAVAADGDGANLSVLLEDLADLLLGDVLAERLDDEVVLIIDQTLALLGLLALLLGLSNGHEQRGAVEVLAVEGLYGRLGGVTLLESHEAVVGVVLLLEAGGSADDLAVLPEGLLQELDGLFFALDGGWDAAHVHVVGLADVTVSAGLEALDHQRSSVEGFAVGALDAALGLLHGAELGIAVAHHAVGVLISADENADQVAELLEIGKEYLLSDRVVQVLDVEVGLLVERLGVVLLPVHLEHLSIDVNVAHGVQRVEGAVFVLEGDVPEVAGVIGVGVSQDVSLHDLPVLREDGEQPLVTHVRRQVAHVKSVVVVVAAREGSLGTGVRESGVSHRHAGWHHRHLHIGHVGHGAHSSTHCLHRHSLHTAHTVHIHTS